MFISWLSFVSLALESSEVISLRVAKLAAGGIDAHREAHLIVNEKMGAIFEIGTSLLYGAPTANLINRFRDQVAANARRLAAEGHSAV